MNILQKFMVIGLVVCGLASCASPPKKYPDFLPETASLMVVLGTVEPGGYFPDFPECKDPGVICMDPPPFWFTVHVKSEVYGKNIPTRIVAATTSHMGMDQFESINSESLLILLLRSGRDFVMPRYAFADLVKNNQGEWYLVVRMKDPIWWLPCSISQLREEIVPSDFPAELLIPLEDASLHVDENPELFRVTALGAMPLYAVSVERLGAHLRSLQPDIAEMNCSQVDDVNKP